MAEWLFNRNGQALLFFYGDRFISADGKNLGWLIGNNVYSLKGNHLGWLERGVLFDRDNNVLAFTANATGYLPSRPGNGGVPASPEIPEAPERPGLRSNLVRQGYGGWSIRTLEQFFVVSL